MSLVSWASKALFGNVSKIKSGTKPVATKHMIGGSGVSRAAAKLRGSEALKTLAAAAQEASGGVKRSGEYSHAESTFSTSRRGHK